MLDKLNAALDKQTATLTASKENLDNDTNSAIDIAGALIDLDRAITEIDLIS